MEDAGHLERMGRELRCPICLSLMTSPASLTCNHTFCNLCILGSMKARANCPVCEVPFRRREIRPAPHMENLISIFRSMEAAAGLNLFTTQATLSQKNTDGANQKTDVKHPDMPRSIKQTKRNKKEFAHGSKANKLSEVDAASDSQTKRVPSLPSKKRVQVTPCLVSETPTRPKKLVKTSDPVSEPERGIDLDLCDMHKESGIPKEDHIKKHNIPVLSPFFWLRDDINIDSDEAMENTNSQQTSGSYLPQPVIPSFSDINDVDNDPIKGSQRRESPGKQNFESEMFEWTQRECSPDLVSTPMAKVSNKDLLGCMLNNAVVETSCMPSPEDGCKKRKMKAKGFKFINGKRKFTKKFQRKNGKTGKATVVGPQEIIPNEHMGLTEILGKVDAATETSRSSSLAMNEDNAGACCLLKSRRHPRKKLKSSFEDNIPVQVCNTDSNQLMRSQDEKKNNSGGKLSDDAHTIQEYIVPSSFKGLPSIERENDQTGRSSPLSCQVKERVMLEPETGRDRIESITKTQVRRNQMAGSKNVKRKGKADPVDVPGSGNGKLKDTTTNVCIKKQLNETKKRNSLTSLRSCVESTDDKVTQVPNALKKLEAKQHHSPQTDPNVMPSSLHSTVEGFQVAKGYLQKCSASHFKCAFCRSNKDTKVSGQMMHYLNGKPVDAKHNEGTQVIHAHKYCMEWAPNVYFDDQMAINLKNEVARSKRIKCSKCGTKGAALGCYDKNCRRSFHFTCAKSMDCRWDNVSFVMLCPLHLASKLPSDITSLEKTLKNKSMPKRDAQSQAEINSDPIAKEQWTMPPGSTYKLLLCCSALSKTDKDVVTEFTKFSGARLSKFWNPNITHVIAATDGNGACKRTLKVLMGIIEGKWILNIDWLKACIRARKLVEEGEFEIGVDNHGIRDGPRLGRLRALQKNPKLFSGCKFYFMGEFTASYKGYLVELVTAAGGTVLQRKPILRDTLVGDGLVSPTYIIYSCELPENQNGSKDKEIIARRKIEAEMLANTCQVLVAHNTWILDSISGSTMLSLPSDGGLTN